jgi:hypothetical protein
MPASDWDVELEELAYQATGRLFAAETLDLVAFDRLYDHLAIKAEAIKDENVLSKQVLSVLLNVRRAFERLAEYREDVRTHIGVAGRFEMLLDLIALGEAPSDRIPGAPRIL